MTGIIIAVFIAGYVGIAAEHLSGSIKRRRPVTVCCAGLFNRIYAG